jgi:hypothetical protein
VVLSCLVALSGLALTGCGKKTNKSAGPSAPPTGGRAAVDTTAGAEKPVPDNNPAPSAAPTGEGTAVNVAADVEKPVAEVQTQAQTMSVANLRATAAQYAQAISVKKDDLQKVLDQVKQLPLTEALSEKAKTLKTEAQKIQTSLKDLTDRFQVYYNKLKEKGGDLSGLATK